MAKNLSVAALLSLGMSLLAWSALDAAEYLRVFYRLLSWGP